MPFIFDSSSTEPFTLTAFALKVVPFSRFCTSITGAFESNLIVRVTVLVLPHQSVAVIVYVYVPL